METAKPASRFGPFDVPDTFMAGFLLAAGLNVTHVVVFILAPVMGMFAPLVGITQFLYNGPLVAEFILVGKKKAAMGVAAATALTLVGTAIRLIAMPWNEEYYFGDEA